MNRRDVSVSRVRRHPPFSCFFARHVSGILSSSRRTSEVKSLVALATEGRAVCYCDARFFFFFFFLLDIDGKRSPGEVAKVLLWWREKSQTKARWWLNGARSSLDFGRGNLAVDNTDRYGVKSTRSFDDQWEELRDFESDSRFRKIFSARRYDTRSQSSIRESGNEKF